MTTELMATAFPSTTRFAGPMYRSIVAVDLEGSTMRTDPVKGVLRRTIYDLLGRALAGAAITDDHLEQITDRGDGALLLIRPHDDVPKTVLLEGLVPQLAALLAEYNAGIQQPALRIRLRVVVHAGEVYADSKGFYGESIDIAIRLLDSASVKKALKAATAPLVVVVSDEIHASIVSHGYVDTDEYQPLVRVRVATRQHRGWVHVPDHAGVVSAVRPGGLHSLITRIPFGVVRGITSNETTDTRREAPIALRTGRSLSELRTKSTADVSRIDRASHTESSPVRDG